MTTVKSKMRVFTAICVSMVCFSSLSSSQNCYPNKDEALRDKSDFHADAPVGKTAVMLFSSIGLADAHVYGSTSDRHLILFGFEYDRSLISRHRFGLSYTPELIPIAVLFQPSIGGFGVPNALAPFTHTQAVYGLGANPAGVEMSFATFGRVRPFIGGDVGFLYFSKNVPLQFAAQFNFAVDVKAGLDFRLKSKPVTIAYVLHHFSNGYQAIENPGLDSQMLYIGFKFPFPARRKRR